MINKKYLVITVILIIVAYMLYYFPIQKYFAEKTLVKYMVAQGVSAEKIKSKRILKDYKRGGYFIDIVYKDDLDFRYTYYYFHGKSSLTDSMLCIVYNKQNVSVRITNEKIKYPPIN